MGGTGMATELFCCSSRICEGGVSIDILPTTLLEVVTAAEWLKTLVAAKSFSTFDFKIATGWFSMLREHSCISMPLSCWPSLPLLSSVCHWRFSAKLFCEFAKQSYLHMIAAKIDKKIFSYLSTIICYILSTFGFATQYTLWSMSSQKFYWIKSSTFRGNKYGWVNATTCYTLRYRCWMFFLKNVEVLKIFKSKFLLLRYTLKWFSLTFFQIFIQKQKNKTLSLMRTFNNTKKGKLKKTLKLKKTQTMNDKHWITIITL